MFWAIFFAVLGGLLLGVALGKTLQKRGEAERLERQLDVRIRQAVEAAITVERAKARTSETASMRDTNRNQIEFIEGKRTTTATTWLYLVIRHLDSKSEESLLAPVGTEWPTTTEMILAAHTKAKNGGEVLFRLAREMRPEENDFSAGLAQFDRGVTLVPKAVLHAVIPTEFRHRQRDARATMLPQAATPMPLPVDQTEASTTVEVAAPPSKPMLIPGQMTVEAIVNADPHAETESPAKVEVEGGTEPTTPEAEAAMAEAKAHVATTAGEFGQVFIPPSDTVPAAPAVQESPVVDTHRPRATLFQGSTASEFGKSEGGGEG